MNEGLVGFGQLAQMQRGHVGHRVSLEDEPFHGLCEGRYKGRLSRRHDAIRCLLTSTLNALEESDRDFDCATS